MTDDLAVEGIEGAYVPCRQDPSTFDAEEEGAIFGLRSAFVAEQQDAAAFPVPDREAIFGQAVGFVPDPCDCNIDMFQRTVTATSITGSTSSTGPYIGASDLGPDWTVKLVTTQNLVKVEVDGTAWVTTISIATNGFEGHAEAKVSDTVANQVGTTKIMRFTIRAMPGVGDYCARIVFNPIGYSPTGPGGIFGGGVTMGSGLGGLGGAPYVSINPFATGSSFVQNQSEIAFTSSVWGIFDYYQIETPTPIPPSFWQVGVEYLFEVRSEDLGSGSIRTTATISSEGGSYSVSITRPTLSLPEYDAPTLTGPEVAILRSFSFGDPDPWIIAVECVDIPEFG